MARQLPGMFGLAGLLALFACSAAPDGADQPQPQTIGLSTSLPIYWSETDDPAQLLRPDTAPHWVRDALEAKGRLVPIDALDGDGGKLPLPGDALLVMAQPWPLSPSENVALDDWVRAGGRVLLFADPMLTRHSAYAVGDRRRPQDVVLLSPILRRWGLELQFDDEQATSRRDVPWEDTSLVVELPGQFALADPAAQCRLEAEALVASCRIGKGRLLAVADAAMLEPDGEDSPEQRKSAFDSLLERLSERD